MATAEQPKYMWVPPPPLPEFYLPKDQLRKKERKPSSSSSSSGTQPEDGDDQKPPVTSTLEKKKNVGKGKKDKPGPAVSGDGAYDGQTSTFRYLPPPPQRTTGVSDIPPLAVYHICRLCLRPRSARYHREHPIPVNGVPPPPGICRRCRVTTVKESSETSEIEIDEVDEVVRKGRSNEIKLGLIAPFVPEEAMVPNEEAKRMHAQQYLRGRSRERHITIFREVSSESQQRYRRSKSRRRDIAYRHLKVVDEPSPERQAKQAPEMEHNASDSGNGRTRVRYERETEQTVTRYPEPEPAPAPSSRKPLKSTNVAALDSTRASESPQGPSSSSTSSAATPKKSATSAMYFKGPERTDSEIRRVAGEEFHQYAAQYAAQAKKGERLESEIRRIAHEEVTRYREAERKLEARPRAYTHGKMVPVPHRIEARDDKATEMPWQKVQKAPPASAVNAMASLNTPESIHSTSYASSQSQRGTERESWGPQWRRELSLERRRSTEAQEQKLRADVTEETRSKVSAQPSDAPKSDKPRSACDVVPGSIASARGSRVPSRTASGAQEEYGARPRSDQADDGVMGFPVPSSTGQLQQNMHGRERETVERLSVTSRTSTARNKDEDLPEKATMQSRWDRSDVGRSTASRSFRRWEATVEESASSSSSRSSRKSWERGSGERAAYMMEKGQEKSGVASNATPRSPPAGAKSHSNMQYEYKLHTVRPADQPGDMRFRSGASSQRSDNPSHVTLEIWQEVPTDPEQRAREAPQHQKEREEAVEWLRKRVDDPKAQVGVDPDGSRRIACSIPHRGSEKERPGFPPRPRESSLQQKSSATDRPAQSQPSTRSQASGNRGGGDRQVSDWPDREMIIQVWEQVPTKEAARYRREIDERSRRRDGGGSGDYVIEAWKQVPSDRAPASSVRRDSAMEIPHVRRRRERREHQQPGEDSAHVKFASKIEISPTPPGSDESSNAFRRFHDFIGRKGARQQIDGHDSEEKGGDLIAEYERRGRSRSREPARRQSKQAYDRRDTRDRDETVRPRERQRKYNGSRDDGWRPLQRALSESPSREWSDRKRTSVKDGPPYHPEEKPSESMTTHDGSRSGGRWW